MDEDAGTRVPGDLMALVRKELIRPERSTLPGQDAFRFRHLLIRDAAYEAIPKGQRAELHERFADWLERVAGDSVEQEEIVAYHLEQAHGYRMQLGPPDERSAPIGLRASARLASAARRATGRGDHVAAANLLGRAVAVGPTRGTDRARVLYDLGDAFAWAGQARQAFAAFEEAAEIASETGDRSLERLARIRRSATQMLTDPHGKPTEAIRSEMEEAVRFFEELGDDAALATVWTELAQIEWMPCRYERAEAAALRALDHARRSGDERLVAAPLLISIFAPTLGTAEPGEGIRGLDDVEGDLARSRQMEAIALTSRAYYIGMQGSFAEARRMIAVSDEIATSLGLRFDTAANQEGLGHLELYAGDAAAAERAFRENYDILDDLGDEGHKSTAAAGLALALCALERFDEAEVYAEIAVRVAAEDDLASQAGGRSALALVLAARGEFVEAERLAREAVELYADAEAEAPNFQGDTWMDLAKVLRAAGKLPEAAEAAREALALYQRKGNVPAAASTIAFIDALG